MNWIKNHKKIVAIFAFLGVFIFGTAESCDSTPPKSSAQSTGQQQTETAFAQQQRAVPYPASELRDSLERRNVKRRLLELNKPDKIGYVYIINFGTVIGYYAIKGKVSNTDSQLTTSDLIERYCRSCSGGGLAVTVPAPGDDGSYGVNESGNFFFTTEGVMVETDLQYLYADQPLPIDVPRLNAKVAPHGK